MEVILEAGAVRSAFVRWEQDPAEARERTARRPSAARRERDGLQLAGVRWELQLGHIWRGTAAAFVKVSQETVGALVGRDWGPAVR